MAKTKTTKTATLPQSESKQEIHETETVEQQKIAVIGKPILNTTPQPTKQKRSGKHKNKVLRGRGRYNSLPMVTQRRILQMRQMGNSVSEIAAATKVARSTVSRVAKRWAEILPEITEVEDFKRDRVDIVQAAQLKAIKSLVKEGKLDSGLPNQIAYALRQLHDIERLERNLSTSNVASISYTGSVLPKGESEE